MRNRTISFIIFSSMLFGFLFPLTGWAQTTVSSGSIQGTITDPSGAVIPGAKITISSNATGQTINLTSSSGGAYNSGALMPGEYVVRVEFAGFKTVLLPVTVQVGVTSAGNLKLEVGHTTTTISVETGYSRVNTEQATVQGVLTAQQIEQLPINGRNFLDLAALEPGVQIQDGRGFDPTKNGFSSISFGSRFGRTARIELDGVDISDETVGTTTQNIPVSGIQEFQVAQSTLDLSTELTSSGAVNVVTRSGSNQFHGEGFGYGRSSGTSARYGNTPVPFDREQYGARFGGPFLKNRLFFFADWERTVQDMIQSVSTPAPFTALSGSYNAPFHESMLMARLDWTIKPNMRAFYRWTYNQNNNQAPFLINTYSPYANRDNTPVQAAGLDITQGIMSHSFRFGYTRFNNSIGDAGGRVTPSGLPTNARISIGPLSGCGQAGDVFCSGPNYLAPQATVQHNTQFKYDASLIKGSHIIRFGAAFNHILGGGYASFYGLGPTFRSSFTSANQAIAASGPFDGGASNPLNWPISTMRFGNGQGFFTEIPSLGYPGGGQEDNRFALYLGDTWKAKPNLTVSFGVRYARDTGRSDSDLPPIQTLNLWGAGLGNRVHQPNRNFAPQLGIAYDPWKSGRTVFRAGAGIYYENAIFNNVMFDRPGRLPKGLFWGEANPCPSGNLLMPDGSTIDTSSFCGAPIGTVLNQGIALNTTYQKATAAAGAQSNPNYIDNAMANGSNSTGNGFLSPDYRTPYSIQMNVGFQHEFKPGTVLSIDYLRNVGLHYILIYDTNHVGDARFLDQGAALGAINATNESYLCPDGVGGIDCAITAGAGIADYANNGLDSGKVYNSGYGDSGTAFPGINSTLGENEMAFPIGRSVYNAMQVSLRSNKQNPFQGVKNLSLQVSYSLSRFESMAQDMDFTSYAYDYANINHFFGPNALDRTHQLSFGGSFDFPHAFRLAYNARFATALPVDMLLPSGTDPGAIYTSDWTGDGSNQDHVLPGTNVGSFGRDVKVSNLNNVISKYNTNVAGTLTPAAKALVNAGLVTSDQMVKLGGVMEPVAAAPAGQVANPPSLNAGILLGWVLRPSKRWASAPENLTLEPTVSIFNVFNFSNWDVLSNELNGGALSVNGTTRANRTNKIYMGSGVYSIGAPRTFEFGLKVMF